MTGGGVGAVFSCYFVIFMANNATLNFKFHSAILNPYICMVFVFVLRFKFCFLYPPLARQPLDRHVINTPPHPTLTKSMSGLAKDEQKSAVMEGSVEVVVIGGGISGLCAAKLLSLEHGVSVVVLEARNRVGGRTNTVEDPKFKYADLGGAQWWLDTVRKACWDELSVRGQLKQTFVLCGSQGMTNFRFKKAGNRLIR